MSGVHVPDHEIWPVIRFDSKFECASLKNLALKKKKTSTIFKFSAKKKKDILLGLRTLLRVIENKHYFTFSEPCIVIHIREKAQQDAHSS